MRLKIRENLNTLRLNPKFTDSYKRKSAVVIQFAAVM